VEVVDAAVTLYLLALVRAHGDHAEAQHLSGLPESQARSAKGWLAQVGVLHTDGTLDEDRLRRARGDDRLSMLAA
jgi:hypothetical protein